MLSTRVTVYLLFKNLKMKIRLLFALVLSLFLYPSNILAQEPIPFQFGYVDQIESKELSETRTLNIYLPQGYEEDSLATYPVIYLLDGSGHEDYPHMAGLVQYFHMYQLMPQSILVGLANVDRYRDFTTPSANKEDQKAIPNAGGTARLMAFIEKELQPFIQEKYRGTGEQTIIGQSLGGLFAAEVLFTQPHLFDNYLIVSPSLWWNDQALVKRAGAFLEAHPNLEKKVYLALGTEGPEMKDGMDKLLAALKEKGAKKMMVHFEPFLKESHATIMHRATYRGFEILFEGKKWD